MIVIVALWWLGARAVGLNESKAPEIPAEREAPPSVTGIARPDTLAPGAARRSVPSVPSVPSAPSTISAASASAEVDALRAKDLLVPVAGVDRTALTSTFDDARGGRRVHEAMDILAPRGTPVLAALDGRIVKLFTSAAGGLTIYQFDAEEEFGYYYAHLDSYASNLSEGELARRGQTIGYVGTTGNAPPGTPHLHFAIFKLGPHKRWWDGDPIDPFLVLR
jgi:murein DD-endopeptidase MepM/ murein hydrolase activator NlpD